MPLLAIFLNYSIYEAIGTSLLVDVIASINVAYHYYRYGRIDLKAGLWLALGAIVGAQVGAHFASFIPQEGLQGGFSVFIILSGLSFFYRAFGKRKFGLNILKFEHKTLRIITIIAIGLYIGVPYPYGDRYSHGSDGHYGCIRRGCLHHPGAYSLD